MEKSPLNGCSSSSSITLLILHSTLPYHSSKEMPNKSCYDTNCKRVKEVFNSFIVTSFEQPNDNSGEYVTY